MDRRTLICGLATGIAGGRAFAQVGPAGGEVVVLDQEALFRRSLFGRRIRSEIERESRALAAENREIEATLAAEELSLTERRAGLEVEAFRQLADAFDARVEGIRRAQDAKAVGLQQRSDSARAVFQERAGPILARMAAEMGALVILDRRSVIAAAEQVDITDAAVARLDDALGDGAGLTGPPAPPPRPPARGGSAGGEPLDRPGGD